MRCSLTSALVLSLLIVHPTPSFGQTSVCRSIADLEKQTYGFRPSKISDAERRQKSAAMDAFWERVKRAGLQGTACLRDLVQKQTDGFAVYDEASLLYSLDRSAKSAEVVAAAIAKADLVEVQPADYVRMGLILARQGADIAGIAHNYINAKNDVTAYLPRHGAYKLDRVAGSILLYGMMPSGKADDALSMEVTSANAETRNTAAIVWSLSLTSRAFRGLAALGSMDGFSRSAKEHVRGMLTPFQVKVTAPKYSREQMLAKIAKFPEMGMDSANNPEDEGKALDNSVYATFTAADVDTLREARRKFITGVSDEAVDGYVEMSRVLLSLINKLGLYAEYRKDR